MLFLSRQLLLSLLLLLGAVGAAGAQAKPAESPPPLPYRWVWTMHNLASNEQVDSLLAVMRRAKAAGYNGVVLSDYKFTILDRMGPPYFANVEKVKAEAKTLGLDLYPTVCPVGYSNGLLAHDPNLAEGLPVRDALFVVKGQQAQLAPDPATGLKNGDFTQVNGNTMTGWDFQDYPGQASFADRAVTHDGHPSLRWDNIGAADKDSGHGRIMQTVAVSPFRQYHLSVWAKTQDFEAPGSVQPLVLNPDGKPLTFGNDWHLEKTQDWKHYDLVFNSGDNKKLSIYLGAWGGKGGTLWWSDTHLEEVGLVNVLRRAGCPLTVKGEDGTLYTEGKDFAPVKDDKLGRVPWDGDYEVWHAPPAITLTPGSRLKDGQTLRVSFYAPVILPGGQVTCCLTDPEVYTLMADQIKRVNALLHPKGFFLSHDEIRIANWCETCQARHETPGQLLAENVHRCVEMVQKVSPTAHIFVWSDMFEPTHNAHDEYYLVNGTWAGSWKGLPSSVVVVNWHPEAADKSLPFFANRGHAQILAGYYDGSPQSIRPWLDSGKAVKGIKGVMYTTWSANYSDLDAFAQAAWGQK